MSFDKFYFFGLYLYNRSIVLKCRRNFHLKSLLWLINSLVLAVFLYRSQKPWLCTNKIKWELEGSRCGHRGAKCRKFRGQLRKKNATTLIIGKILNAFLSCVKRKILKYFRTKKLIQNLYRWLILNDRRKRPPPSMTDRE